MEYVPKRPVVWLRSGFHNGFTQPHFGRNTDKVRDDIVTTNSSERKPRFSQSGAGFTLIELMVVIAIIGTLSLIGLYQIKVAIPKAHDAKRLTDTHDIVNIVTLYMLDNGAPTLCSVSICSSASGVGYWFFDSSFVMFKEYGVLPKDPINAYVSGKWRDYRIFAEPAPPSEASFCCRAGAGFDACKARHAGWAYVKTTLERPNPNLKKIDPQCDLGSGFQNDYLANTVNLVPIPPPNIF